MILTFNANKYSELLTQYQPKIIRTEAKNEKALAISEELMYRPDRSPEENGLYDLLITLIKKFEQEYYSQVLIQNLIQGYFFLWINIIYRW